MDINYQEYIKYHTLPGIKKVFILLILLITLLLFSPRLFAEKVNSEKQMTLLEGQAVIRTEYEKKRKKMADYYLDKALFYIPALEKYLDSSFPIHDITIWLDEKPGHAYKYSNGVKLVRHHLGTKYPAVLFHEFGHFYYRSWTEKWLVEGINSFLPIAIAEYGLLDKDEMAYDYVMSTWGFHSINNSQDQPVIIDFRNKVWHFYYVKTFKIQYLIYRELGKEKYRKFVQDVAEGMKEITYTNSTTLDLLRKYKKIKWKDFLSGWVYEGKYGIFPFDIFGDKDKNGISDIVDFYEKNPSAMSLVYGK